MVKKANHEKNCTTPSFFIVAGICPIFSRISVMNLFFFAFSFLKASIFSGGYSEVVKIVYNTLAKNTNPPMAKATLTDIGTTPEIAELLTPN